MSNFTRFVLLFFHLLFLVGCDTIPEKRPYRPYDKLSNEVTANKESDHKSNSIKTYKYGRFEVQVYENGSQKIVGGVFTDLPPLIFDSVKPHVIVINYQTKTLMYYLFEEGIHRPKIGFAVVTPSADVLPNQVVRGIVQSIDTKPTWCPTDNIRQEIKNLPKGCIPYGHPQNFMGEAKFNIKWEAKGWDLIRLHGTNGYPLGFWKEKTFGCTRLENEAIKDLITQLGLKAVKEGIEVIVHADPSEAEVFDAS